MVVAEFSWFWWMVVGDPAQCFQQTATKNCVVMVVVVVSPVHICFTLHSFGWLVVAWLVVVGGGCGVLLVLVDGGGCRSDPMLPKQTATNKTATTAILKHKHIKNISNKILSRCSGPDLVPTAPTDPNSGRFGRGTARAFQICKNFRQWGRRCRVRARASETWKYEISCSCVCVCSLVCRGYGLGKS